MVGGMMMAACSSDDMSTVRGDIRSDVDAISFGISLPNPTRATFTGKTAADKLGRNFIVHGLKYYSATEPVTAADVADTEKQQTVFDLYNVNYTDGAAATTQSNSTGWEYVGYLSHKNPAEEQTIRFWDYDAKAYVFSAVSGSSMVAEKVESGATVYDKGWKITVPAGGALSNLYTSARKVVLNPNSGGGIFSGVVDLTFYSVLSKIRFAMYETVPGYSIHIDRFYYDNATSSTETNFAVDGGFRMANQGAETVLNVSYYDGSSSLENRPKVSFDESAVTASNYGIFGTNITAQPTIGTTSNEATYDQTGGDYTVILPYSADDNHLSLRVDYTLKALNGNETIHVSGATASIPAGYLQWRENYAYTYLFKISDNTNGSTTPGGPEGLYPITFDGCVVTDEEGIQESVTTVTQPSVTTYQKGEVVTVNDEYEAGDIYFSVVKDGATVDIDADAKVYEVFNCGHGEVTESQLSHYADNALVLMPVSAKDAMSQTPAGLPMSDGTYQPTEAKKCFVFQADAGKTYAINYKSGTYNIYKVLKVVGTSHNPTFSLTADQTPAISSPDAKATLTLTSSSPVTGTYVQGAARLMKVFFGAVDVTDKFLISEEPDFTYSVGLRAETVKAGNPSGAYTLMFANSLASIGFDVNLTYTVSANPTIAAGNATGSTVELRVNGQLAEGDVVNANEGVKVESTATGKYKVTADALTATGSYGITIGGCPVIVNVNHYDFDTSNLVLTWCEGVDAPKGRLVITPVAKDAPVSSSVTSVVADGTSDETGAFLFTPLHFGKTVLTYETARCEVTVDKYELTSDVPSFVQGTGKATLSLFMNGEQVSARSGNVKVYKAATAAGAQAATVPITTGFEIVTTGRMLEFKNLTAAGVYRIDYLADGKVIGTETITVNQNTK